MGSTFYFTIPYKPIETNKNILNFSSKPFLPIINKELTILLAEDDATNYEFIREICSNHPITLLRAFNGQEAVDLCTKNTEIDMVLMDIKMPIMDGYRASKMIKQTKPHLPIIALTAYSLPEEKELAYNSGCIDYLTKPVTVVQVIEIIKKYSKG
jgi:CheY-like chemotaxis protein